MLFLNENLQLTDPTQINDLSVNVKNILFSRLEKGTILFLVPKDFPLENKKHLKNVYKIGFIYDCLSLIYSDYGKEKKHKIISEEYHFDFSYRRFTDILQDYEKDRENFIFSRNTLGLRK